MAKTSCGIPASTRPILRHLAARGIPVALPAQTVRNLPMADGERGRSGRLGRTRGDLMQDGRTNPLFALRFARLLFAVAAIVGVSACASMSEYTEADYDPGSAPAEKFANDARAC